MGVKNKEGRVRARLGVDVKRRLWGPREVRGGYDEVEPDNVEEAEDAKVFVEGEEGSRRPVCLTAVAAAGSRDRGPEGVLALCNCQIALCVADCPRLHLPLTSQVPGSRLGARGTASEPALARD